MTSQLAYNSSILIWAFLFYYNRTGKCRKAKTASLSAGFAWNASPYSTMKEWSTIFSLGSSFDLTSAFWRSLTRPRANREGTSPTKATVRASLFNKEKVWRREKSANFRPTIWLTYNWSKEHPWSSLISARTSSACCKIALKCNNWSKCSRCSLSRTGIRLLRNRTLLLSLTCTIVNSTLCLSSERKCEQWITIDDWDRSESYLGTEDAMRQSKMLLLLLSAVLVLFFVCFFISIRDRSSL